MVGAAGELPGAGERVRLPWGLDVVDGRVIDAYDGGSGPRVVVEVMIPGVDDGMDLPTVAVPLNSVVPAEPEQKNARRSSWAQLVTLTRHVTEVARSVLSEGARVEVNTTRNAEEFDTILVTPYREIFIDVKKTSAQGILSARRIDSFIRRVPPGAAALIVTDGEVGSSALSRIRRSRVPVRIVTWRNPADDVSLESAIRELQTAAAGESHEA
jgi:hypothetical protein